MPRGKGRARGTPTNITRRSARSGVAVRYYVTVTCECGARWEGTTAYQNPVIQFHIDRQIKRENGIHVSSPCRVAFTGPDAEEIAGFFRLPDPSKGPPRG